MVDETDDAETQNETLFDRWQEEQRKWQRLMTEYVDKASTDESFLTNLGNAMRGSLLANKPYPGTSAGPGQVAHEPEGAPLDELVFAVRRLEGQLLDLTVMVESLAGSAPASRGSATQDETGSDNLPASQ